MVLRGQIYTIHNTPILKSYTRSDLNVLLRKMVAISLYTKKKSTTAAKVDFYVEVSNTLATQPPKSIRCVQFINKVELSGEMWR